MALQQIIQHPTGTYSQYWKIVQTNLDYITKTGTIKMFGYISEQARLENRRHLDYRSFDVSEGNFETYFVPSAIDPQDINQVKNAYLYIKSIPDREFFGSTDI
jgi:hypothetical protein